MNFYDSGKICDLLKPLGYKISESPEKCDLAILNTCHIREKASEKMYSDIGRLSKYKKAQINRGKDMIIAICGCVAQAEGERILKKNRVVDMIFGPQNYHLLPKKIIEKERNKKYLEINFPIESKFDYFPEPSTKGFTSFVSVQEGCDKFCTFCVVPYTRGAEFCRPAIDIIKEVEQLTYLGVQEVTLLGQNVNAYKGTFYNEEKKKIELNLAGLFRELEKIKNLNRIRYITSHPSDVDEDLIIAHKKINKLMPYLHLPIQSGSNKILKAMNRKYTKERYLEIIQHLKKARPDIAITSDFIVGFPGETDTDFDDTMDVVKSIKFAGSYSFKYSARPGTPASLLKHTIEDDISNKRLKILQEELTKYQTEFNNSFLGRNLSVLFEKKGKKDNQYVGRSEYLQPVHVFSKKSLIGKILNVDINKITSFSLHGIVK